MKLLVVNGGKTDWCHIIDSEMIVDYLSMADMIIDLTKWNYLPMKKRRLF